VLACHLGQRPPREAGIFSDLTEAGAERLLRLRG
jgi:hypothetical protein